MFAQAHRHLIERHLDAYNRFDVDGMVALLAPEVFFEKLSGGRVTTSAVGIEAFRKLAEHAKILFS
ncbi:MAG TPA: hypothetical protein VFY81_01160 [Gammaproteobacteria bacterium]|nr:hypothetical protein [Gammaproteobacteria bacterium]